MLWSAKILGRIMRGIVITAAMLLALGVAAVRFLDQAAHAPPVPAARAAAPVAAAVPSNARSVVLSRGKGGHFWADARVDGRRLGFVIDTGASHIALRESDAARLGLRPTPRDYTAKVQTANGIGLAAVVQLRMVEVGDIVVRDLPALVHPDSALGVNLLGMSFLAKVRWSYERGKLLLEQ
jgi:aspartyl protease family protein